MRSLRRNRLYRDLRFFARLYWRSIFSPWTEEDYYENQLW